MPSKPTHIEAPTTIVTLPLAEIIVRDELQVRRRLDQAAVSAYTSRYKAGNPMPAVKVARVNGRSLVLVDGWHRVAALRALGHTKVEAEIIDTNEFGMYWEAAKANIGHGVPLRSTEYRQVFRNYIRARQHGGPRGKLKSYRDIAAEIGGTKSYSTIRNWMRLDFPKIFEEMGGEGDGDTGGSRDLPKVSHDEELLATGISGAAHAVAAARGISDPAIRGRLVQELRRALEAAQSGPFKIEEDDF